MPARVGGAVAKLQPLLSASRDTIVHDELRDARGKALTRDTATTVHVSFDSARIAPTADDPSTAQSQHWYVYNNKQQFCNSLRVSHHTHSSFHYSTYEVGVR